MVFLCEFRVEREEKRCLARGGFLRENTKIIWIYSRVFRSFYMGVLGLACLYISLYVRSSVKFSGVQQETERPSQYLCTYIGGRDIIMNRIDYMSPF